MMECRSLLVVKRSLAVDAQLYRQSSVQIRPAFRFLWGVRSLGPDAPNC